MRKYAVLVLLIPLFLLSCKKNNLSATTSAPNSDEQLKIEAASPAMQQIFQNVKALHSQQLKKLAFRLLSAKEKYLIWADNIQTVSANFNPAQTALAAELKDHFKVFFLTDSSRYKMAIARDAWLDKAQKIFTNDQIRNLAFKLYTSTDDLPGKKDALQINNLPKKKDCDCNAGSVFSCGSGFTDGLCSSNYIQDCQKSSWECGFGFGWPCNNLCIEVPM